MSDFNKLYMRPNLLSSGQVPASGPLSASPDIWVAGDKPVPDYKTSLAEAASYLADCATNLVQNKDNYIYVRAKNGGAANASNNVTLYWADGAVIQWPSRWLNNIIGTDLDPSAKGNITNLAPGAVGVADRPFVWRQLPPYAGSCHYCLIAQLNDDRNSNPAPSVASSIDMALLVQNNLQWGWRNVKVVDSGESVIWSYDTMLTVPQEINDETKEYMLLLNPENIPAGCKVSFTCSQPDAKGKAIAIAPTDVPSGNQPVVGGRWMLEPGYNAMVSVYLHNPQKLPLPLGCSLGFEADYYANAGELEKHNAMHLYDQAYTNRILSCASINASSNGALLRLGGYKGLTVAKA